MLRIGPAILIHTSRTGASSFSAILRDGDPTAPLLAFPRMVVFRHFRRQRIAVAVETGVEAGPPHRPLAGLARQGASLACRTARHQSLRHASAQRESWRRDACGPDRTSTRLNSSH